MAVTWLRHAPLAKEYQKRFVGKSDISIDESLFEFEKVEEIYKKEYDLIFASSLKRTQQTLKKLGKNFEVSSLIDEVEFKEEIELKSFEEIELLESYNPSCLENLKSWHEYVCAESLSDFRKRVNEFKRDLPKDKEILICTHGGVLRELFGRNFDYLEWYELS